MSSFVVNTSSVVVHVLAVRPQIGLMPHTHTQSNCRYDCMYSGMIQYVILLMFILHKTAGATTHHSHGILGWTNSQEMSGRVSKIMCGRARETSKGSEQARKLY